METLSINDSTPLTTHQARAHQPPHIARTTPSTLPDIHSKPVPIEGTWKRISRIAREIDTIMEEAVGEKRGAGGIESQSELLKKEGFHR